MFQVTGGEALSAASDVARLATPIAWAVGLFFLRDVYQEHKTLRNDVHGKGGINERVARLEGAQETVHE